MSFQGDIDLARRITDKFLFKEWLKEKGCEDLVVPTLGYYRSATEMRNRGLEEHTILKPTHLSGMVIIIRETRKLTSAEISQLDKWINTDYYKPSRAKSYKNITHGIIHEPILLDSNSSIPMDYKFFCFHGEPFMIQVDLDRFTNHTEQFYSKKWSLLDFSINFPRNPNSLDKPECLEKALSVASCLSSDFVFCRVDLYLLPNRVIKAGEITFFPAGGMGIFSPKRADFLLGEKMRSMVERRGKRVRVP